MKKNYSNLFKPSKKTISKTISLLKAKKLVAIPTETVYGLAGNAYSDIAVSKIYSLKKRPKKNPIIIHYKSLIDSFKDVEINQNLLKLFKKFCPGPITFVVKRKKNSKISRYAHNNLETLAIRFPANKITKKILKKIEFPLAMPSANISTQISPVSAEDVYEEFKNKIDLILDSGRSNIGLESTVVDVTNNIKILRPGSIGIKEISKVLGTKVYTAKSPNKIKSPGMLKKHYSPGIPMVINHNSLPVDGAYIVLGKKFIKNSNVFSLSISSNLREAAKNLYITMRKIKNLNYKKIYVAKIPYKGIGIAINDRLKRASKK